jgi:Family of unknown function (DUF5678)
MIRHAWRVAKTFLYFCGMGRRRRPREIEPVRLPAGLNEEYAGLWVAVKDGRVITAAESSRDLVAKVRQLGAAGEGAVAQFVPPYSEEIVIGVG